jgi:hypothetical protein
MRRVVSIIVAVILFLLIVCLAFSGSIVWSDYFTGLAIALTTIILGVLYWGFKPQIHGFFKKNEKLERAEIKTEPKTETVRTETNISERKESRKSALLPDNTEITKLNVNEELLDEIYEQAYSQVIETYHDAKLSHLAIQVFPFREFFPNINIYFTFYSKSANKNAKFRYSEFQSQVEHITPDKRVRIDYDREVFADLPWKESPEWTQFLKRAYVRLNPISPNENSNYNISARAYSQDFPWTVTFEDGYSGEESRVYWNGKGLDENSMKYS